MVLMEHNAFDIDRLNIYDRTALKMLQMRIDERNPYESNLSDMIKIKPFFEGDNQRGSEKKQTLKRR